MDRLIIIGNGFDLAHGYKTTYKHFSESVHCEALKIFELLTRKYCSEEVVEGVYWYEFEEMVDSMVKNWFHQLEILNWPQFDYESEEGDAMRQLYQNIQADIEIFPLIMHQIERELCQYLTEETKGNRDFRLVSISSEFEKQGLILSFNYTDIAERYTGEVFHIHGSLKENHIVFGHPPDPEMACITPIEGTLMDKTRLRDRLGYARHIMEHGSSKDRNCLGELMKGYEAFQDSFYSHDGEYRKIDRLPMVTQDWIARYRKEQPYRINRFDTDSIKNLIIIGHSVRSDIDIFEQLLRTFSRLTNVTIYTYLNEAKVDLSWKEKFFTERGLPVIFKLYE